jgi:hypothetical protein
MCITACTTGCKCWEAVYHDHDNATPATAAGLHMHCELEHTGLQHRESLVQANPCPLSLNSSRTSFAAASEVNDHDHCLGGISTFIVSMTGIS